MRDPHIALGHSLEWDTVWTTEIRDQGMEERGHFQAKTQHTWVSMGGRGGDDYLLW